MRTCLSALEFSNGEIQLFIIAEDGQLEPLLAFANWEGLEHMREFLSLLSANRRLGSIPDVWSKAWEQEQ